MKMELSFLAGALAAVLPSAGLAEDLVLECERFDACGGWVVDAQFMDQMGSPYLLAHGLGRPVEDARTTLACATGTTVTAWVRTKNWTAPWAQSGGAGAFELRVNGRAVGGPLGLAGDGGWLWEKAGEVRLEKGDNVISLHDLDGFDGRCDAICLTDARTPPSARPAMNEIRRTLDFDLVVAGGGVAGVCAAVSAARLGLRVALVEARPVLGGANSSEVRVHLGGHLNQPPYEHLGDVVAEIGPAHGGNAQPAANYEDGRKAAVVAAETNVTVFLHTRVTGVVRGVGGAIASVLGTHAVSGEVTAFRAPLFVDSTGDAAVGFLAGADYRMGREGRDETGEGMAPPTGDSMTMGASVQWYAKKTDAPVDFPVRPWMIAFNEDNCEYGMRGDWDWETGMRRDQITEFERIRDYGMLVVYSNWAYLKGASAKRGQYAKAALDWVAYVAGKRESRRLLGDHILTQQDLDGYVDYPDGTCKTTWSVDLHYPMPRVQRNYPGEPFRSISTHDHHHGYAIPYRCLYSRNVPNLFMAGRDISVTHVALGTVRVMRTTGMMGEVVGMAASVCRRHGVNPRAVYETYFGELRELMKRGCGRGLPQPPQTYNAGGMLKGEPPVRTPADAAEPVRGSTALRIVCVGDSITAGTGGVTYRSFLRKMLDADGFDCEFAGTQRSDGTRHEAYAGKTAEEVAKLYRASVARCNADVILLHAGHNHSAEQSPVAGIVAANRSVIDVARAVNPAVTVLVAKVTESGKLPKYGYIPELNRALERMAREADTPQSRVIAVDVAGAFDWRTDAAEDRVHPNPAGAEKIARAWRAALAPLLPRRK